jgi:hypothetical protein
MKKVLSLKLTIYRSGCRPRLPISSRPMSCRSVSRRPFSCRRCCCKVDASDMSCRRRRTNSTVVVTALLQSVFPSSAVNVDVRKRLRG